MKFFKEKNNILVAISGEGRRFQEAGYDLPKPLIPVLGKRMVEWGLKSCDFLNQLEDYNLIFTVREEHLSQFNIDQKLKEIFGKKIIIVPINTSAWPKGQAGHALKAKKYINNSHRLFIYSCDTFSVSPMPEMIEAEDPDGILPCFIATEDRFSYAKVDHTGYVCQTAEKKPISNLATTGHYYFRQGLDFVEAVESMIAKGETFRDEYYVAPCYNFLINKGLKIKTVLVSSNWVLGTPAELDEFIKNYPVK